MYVMTTPTNHSSGTFQFSSFPTSYNSAKESPILFCSSKSLYFLYNWRAALASSTESCVSDCILIPRKNKINTWNEQKTV